MKMNGVGETTASERRPRPGVNVARALALQEEGAISRPSWLILAVALVAALALGVGRLGPVWGAGDDPGADDPAVTRFSDEGENDDDEGGDDPDTGSAGDSTGKTGTTGPSDPGALTDGNNKTGPTGNTGTFTDGNIQTGPTGTTGPNDGTLTDGKLHTGPTGNTNTATDGQG